MSSVSTIGIVSSWTQTLRSYSGYEYADQVNQLFQQAQSALRWFDELPNTMGWTAVQIYDAHFPPVQNLMHLEWSAEKSRQDLAQKMDALPLIVRAICKFVQEVVFGFMNTDRRRIKFMMAYDFPVHPEAQNLSDELKRKETEFMNSVGLKVEELALKNGTSVNLHVLALAPTEIRISFCSYWTASIEVGVNKISNFPGKYFVCVRPIKEQDLSLLKTFFLPTMKELLEREPSAEAVWVDGVQSPSVARTLKQMHFTEKKGYSGLWLDRESLGRAPASERKILPGEGPFLPTRQLAST